MTVLPASCVTFETITSYKVILVATIPARKKLREIVEKYEYKFPSWIPLTEDAKKKWEEEVKSWVREIAEELGFWCALRCEETYCNDEGSCSSAIEECTAECEKNSIYVIVHREGAEPLVFTA